MYSWSSTTETETYTYGRKEEKDAAGAAAGTGREWQQKNICIGKTRESSLWRSINCKMNNKNSYIFWQKHGKSVLLNYSSEFAIADLFAWPAALLSVSPVPAVSVVPTGGSTSVDESSSPKLCSNMHVSIMSLALSIVFTSR